MTSALAYVLLVFFVREGVPHVRAELMPSMAHCERIAQEIFTGIRGDDRFASTMIYCNTILVEGTPT
jgi:hypothetical protein